MQKIIAVTIKIFLIARVTCQTQTFISPDTAVAASTATTDALRAAIISLQQTTTAVTPTTTKTASLTSTATAKTATETATAKIATTKATTSPTATTTASVTVLPTTTTTASVTVAQTATVVPVVNATTAISNETMVIVESSWNLGLVIVIVVASGVAILGFGKCV